ncbi:FecCD family ABC transporter permease [Hathewaya histolytica]|uniref:FecCD family ABC transporter permease n=1 Tax=Hathewaya histolytica TaxID=1498 RepID=UPI003B67E905
MFKKIRKIPTSILYFFLIPIFLISIIYAITYGSVHINASWVWKIVSNKIINREVFAIVWPSSMENIIWDLRLPRVILAALVGAGLSISGLLMQALTKNSLADPYVLGISSGASTGAVSAILLGAFSYFGQYGVAVGAFLGSLLSTILVFRIANLKNRFTTTRLILTGVAVGSMSSAITNFIVFRSKNAQKLYSAMFWMTGSLAGSQWSFILPTFLVLFISIILAFILNKSLDAMLLGEDVAMTLGVSTRTVRKVIIILSTLLTGIMVSVSGIIGFVGLIIPHMARSIVGSSHKKLIPLVSLIGAIFLVWADVFARVLVSSEELPIGVVTSFLGAPFFLWLIRKSRYSFGGK